MASQPLVRDSVLIIEFTTNDQLVYTWSVCFDMSEMLRIKTVLPTTDATRSLNEIKFYRTHEECIEHVSSDLQKLSGFLCARILHDDVSQDREVKWSNKYKITKGCCWVEAIMAYKSVSYLLSYWMNTWLTSPGGFSLEGPVQLVWSNNKQT